MAVEEGAGYEESPTYSVAIIAFIFILVSLLVERGIHRLKKYLKKKQQKPLRKTLDKMTEELMLLGFISLLITVFQNPIVKFCVSERFARHMLPCERDNNDSPAFAPISPSPSLTRRLLNVFKVESTRVSGRDV